MLSRTTPRCSTFWKGCLIPYLLIPSTLSKAVCPGICPIKVKKFGAMHFTVVKGTSGYFPSVHAACPSHYLFGPSKSGKICYLVIILLPGQDNLYVRDFRLFGIRSSFSNSESLLLLSCTTSCSDFCHFIFSNIK